MAIAPDYLVLVFFAVRLYYSERLAFFDVFLKGGAYFASGLLVLTLVSLARGGWPVHVGDWERLWIAALILMPVWLIAPLVNRALKDWIDRRVLKRRYSQRDAERLFSHALQAAATEQQLADRAADTLALIFNCPAEVSFKQVPLRKDPADIIVAVVPNASIRLRAGRSSRPFLSEDQSLLQALAAILGAFLHAVQLRRLRDEQQAREQELRTLATRAELRALRAQINPHFLINALNAVAGCIRTRPEVADDTLTQLAEVFRYTLSRSEKEWVRLAEELEFVTSYLAVERTRFGDRLLTTVNADQSASPLIVPAMIVQPLVENAVKHGTSRLTSVGEIEVNVRHSAGRLQIRVSDNGPGFPPAMAIERLDRGHGLRNVAERLYRHYGDAGILQWHNGAERTIVTIEIPTEAAQCAC